MGRPVVVISILGTQLDSGTGPARWNRWRPTVSLFQHEEVLIDRLVLLHGQEWGGLRRRVAGDIRRLSPETAIESKVLPLDDPWDFEEVYGALHDFARSYEFKPEDEDYWIHISTGSHVCQICLFLLTESRFLPGQLLQTGPPRRSHASRAGTWALIDLDLARYDKIAQRFDREQQAATSFLKAGIDTRNEAFNRLIDRIEQVSIASTAPILLTGPTGAGKSQLARRIYALKHERLQVRGRLVEVNCATLRGDAAMSTLFGHVRGAYTGADRDRAGLLRTADGGLLFLDEIGELGLDEQAMLLRALEEKRFSPVGSDREVQSDFQLIAGTNRDLHRAVAEGRFREDLLARIDLWRFSLPGLASRSEDIAPNLAFELDQFARRSGRRVALNAEARRRFLRFATGPEASWSANFRDLNAAVTRMGTLAGGGRIDTAGVEEEIGRLRASWAPAGREGTDHVVRLLGEVGAADLDHFDRVQLEAVLAVCTRSRTMSEAGRALFAVSRTKRKTVNDADRVRKYLARFGLTWAALQGPPTHDSAAPQHPRHGR